MSTQVRCDQCRKMVEPFDVSGWIRLLDHPNQSQVAPSPLIYRLDNLDYCSPECVIDAMKLLIKAVAER